MKIKGLHFKISGLLKTQLIIFALLFIISGKAQSQTQSGSNYHDFTLTTFQDNETFHLYSYLDEGKMVILDFFEYE